MIEPFKYLIQPVALERNSDGRVTRELPGETVTVYSTDQAVDMINRFELELANLNDRSDADASRRDLETQDQVR